MLIRIDALSNQGTRIFETYLRVTAQRHALLLACPVIPEIPDISPSGHHIERKPIRVAERVIVAGNSGLPNGHIRECHSRLPDQRQGQMLISLSKLLQQQTDSVRVKIQDSHPELNSGHKNTGWCWIDESSMCRRRHQMLVLFLRQWQSADQISAGQCKRTGLHAVIHYQQ